MDILIVTGISGAGKSLVVSILEDIGYFCVDNLPGKMLEKLLELCSISLNSGGSVPRVAVVMDVRSYRLEGDEMFQELEWLRSQHHAYHLLFLDCDTSVLVQRFQEQRRSHPLMGQQADSLEEAIALERKMLEQVRGHADYLIDTSATTPAQLKEKIRQLFLADQRKSMLVSCMSFGFKHGIPREADLVFDVRCLPNPHYVPELKEKTGQQREVQDYVMDSPDSKMMMEKIQEMAAAFLPLYVKEGKSQLTLAFGCTGGKHRSVTFAELVGQYLMERGYSVMVIHRDIPAIRKT